MTTIVKPNGSLFTKCHDYVKSCEVVCTLQVVTEMVSWYSASTCWLTTLHYYNVGHVKRRVVVCPLHVITERVS